MTDWLHKLTDWIDHNRYTFIGGLVGVVLLIYSAACQPTTISPITGDSVTRGELDYQVGEKAKELRVLSAESKAAYEASLAELTTLGDNVKPAYDDLERKETAIAEAYNLVTGLATTAAGSWAGPLGTALGIAGILFGVGVKADNVRKDAVITAKTAEADSLRRTG